MLYLGEKVKMAKEKQETLTPEIKNFMEFEEVKRSNQQLEQINIKDLILDKKDDESYIITVLKELFNKENISTKTEYRNVNENFVGTKLTFLAKYGNFPYLNEFVEIFETKRVSLERKGRIEIIKALEKREQEEQMEHQKKMAGLLGV